MNELPVTVGLAPELHDATLRTDENVVRTRIEVTLSTLLDELGVAARPTVRLVEQVPRRGHPIRVELRGRVCRTPHDVFAQALAYVNGTEAVVDLQDRATVSRLLHEISGHATQLGELIALVCRSAAADQPEILLPDDDLLASVLDAGLSLAGHDPAVARERLGPHLGEVPPGLATARLELLVQPQYLQELTTQRDGSELFSLMRDGLFVELGLLPPQMHLQLDPTLPVRGFAFRVNGVRTLPRIGLTTDTILVNDTAERLRLMNVEATDAMNPANGKPGAITQATHQNMLELAGYTTWDAFGYYILALAAAVRARAFALMTVSVANGMLERLDRSFPAVVAAARDFLPPGVLIGTLRALLRDGVTVRNLRRVIELLLRYEEVPPEAGVDRVQFVRAGLADQIGMKITGGSQTAVVFLLDPEIERAVVGNGDRADDELGERLADAVLGELQALPRTAQVPAVLTEERCRQRVRDLLRHEFPQLSVISYAELPPHTNVQPVARISW